MYVQYHQIIKSVDVNKANINNTHQIGMLEHNKKKIFIKEEPWQIQFN